MKKVLLSLTMLFLVCTAWAQSGYWTDKGNYDISWYDGNNTGEYHIKSANQLAGLAYLSEKQDMIFSDTRIILDQNIDLSAHYWTPIKIFSGFLDGNGHTISGMKISDAQERTGLIAQLKGQSYALTDATIYRLSLDATCQIDLNVSDKETFIGGFVGEATERTILADCQFQGVINLTSNNQALYIGGIAGSLDGTILNCNNKGKITIEAKGTSDIDCGGIAGYCNGRNIRITNCKNEGMISANSTSSSLKGISLGGIAGSSFSGCIINSCLNTGEVKATYTTTNTTYISIMAAGISSSNYGLIINSGNQGDISVNSSYKARSGGICSSNQGSIINCYNTADIICNGSKDSGFYNNGGGIAGIHQYIEGVDIPYIYRCYNFGQVTSTGSDKEIGSIVGSADYFLHPSKPSPDIRSTYYNNTTGKPVGNDYYHLAENITSIAPELMTEDSFLDKMNDDRYQYNTTTTTDKMHVWIKNGKELPHFEQADVFCSAKSFYTANLSLLFSKNRPKGDLLLRYRKTTDENYQEITWGNENNLQIETAPNSEYQYWLVLKNGNDENVMPTKTFKTGNVFEEISITPSMNHADILALIRGDRSIIRNIKFEIYYSNYTGESMDAYATTVEGGSIDEYGFVQASVSQLQPNTFYTVRVVLETTQGTFYSHNQGFRTKSSGCYVKTLEDSVTQTTITLIHTVLTKNMDPTLTLKESGCIYIPRDSVEKHPEYYHQKENWIKVKGEPISYNQESNVFKTRMTGLVEGCIYYMEHYFILENQQGELLQESYLTSFVDLYTTLPVSSSWEVQSVTQTTAKIKGTFVIGDAQVIDKGIYADGVEYSLMDKDSIAYISNLVPGSGFYAYSYIKTVNGIYKSDMEFVQTPKIQVNSTVEEIGQTSALISIKTDAGDATVVREGIAWKTNNQVTQVDGSPCRIINLPENSVISYRAYAVTQIVDPNTQQSYEFYHYSDWKTLNTKKIDIIIDKADACSNTSATLHADVTCDTYSNAEFGFEWRKYDAPELVPSETVLAPAPINGKLAFSLRGLSPSTYYKYRAFIRYQGKEYFSDWIGFSTADSFVLFPPTVYTITITSPDGTSVTLVGYVIAGSEDILQKGFEYWIEENNTRTADRKTVIVEGQDMQAILNDLQPNTTYKYRCFAKTASGTTYGEEMEFTTGNGTTQIETVETAEDFHLQWNNSQNRLTIEGTEQKDLIYRAYSLNGRLMEQNRILAQDGCTQITLQTCNYPKGIYLIQVLHKNKIKNLKVIIK